MSILYFLTIALFIIICVMLCFVVLIQESKGGGLGASFGGDVGDSVFGTATAQVLKTFTAWLAAIFLTLCVILSLWTSVSGRSTSTQNVPTIEETTQY
ncbi:MAG: preprotein translocase subunit SecG [Chlamydiales bacterium]